MSNAKPGLAPGIIQEWLIDETMDLMLKMLISWRLQSTQPGG